MYRPPPPSETMRRSLSGLFNRLHGEPVERAVAPQRGLSVTRNRIERIADARRLRREIDWLD